MPELETFELLVDVRDTEADEIDRATRALWKELSEFGVHSVTSVGAIDVPVGIKGDAVTVGVLAVAVLPQLVPKLVELFQNWTSRGVGRRLRVRLEADGRSVEIDVPGEEGSLDDLLSKAKQALKSRNEVPAKRAVVRGARG